MLNPGDTTFGDSVSHVRELATLHGGRCTWLFSTDDPYISPLIVSPAGYRYDITRVLSAHWALEHARGQGLAAAFGTSRPSAHFNSTIRRLVQYAIMARELPPSRISDDRSSGNQTPNETIALHHHYMRQGFSFAGTLAVEFGQRSGGVQRLVDNLNRGVANKTDVYLEFYLQSTGGAHGMAAWITCDLVTFFDPNYGEFEFPNPERFTAWLGTYFSATGYCDGLEKILCTFREYRPVRRDPVLRAPFIQVSSL